MTNMIPVIDTFSPLSNYFIYRVVAILWLLPYIVLQIQIAFKIVNDV